MTAPEHPDVTDQAKLLVAIDQACAAIAPNWPLDRLIAVSPYWNWIDRPFHQASQALERLNGSRLTMPAAYYRQAWQAGEIRAEHLQQAMDEAGHPHSLQSLLAALDQDTPALPSLPLLSDLVDFECEVLHHPAWRDAITQQLSQFCAAFFDQDQADWHPAHTGQLYVSWRKSVQQDHSVSLLMHAHQLRQRATALPADAVGLIRWAVQKLAIPADSLRDYLTLLLLRINGWAAWCAYLRWQARLHAGDDQQIVELLACRLAWECLLDDGERGVDSVWHQWQQRWAAQPVVPPAPHLSPLALWQRAQEVAYQQPLARQLAEQTPTALPEPSVQAVFCIDVRSEVFRRALEQTDPAIHTHGFAGFFGLPIAYTPLGTTASRPQLPGLLAPCLKASDSTGDPLADAAISQRRQLRLRRRASWNPFRRLPAASFALVESLGLGYLRQLLQQSLPSQRALQSGEDDGLSSAESCQLRPTLQFAKDDPQPALDLAERVLRAMGMTDRLSRLVLLVGHGSQSANNPHAAGLHCGACCGQTGEVNARALAALLNDAALRQALQRRAIDIPDSTCFLAGLHNTTTDDITLFDTTALPDSHAADLQRLRQALTTAATRARAERASQIGLAATPELDRAFRRRANDWAQTRPEWGLVNNGCFIAAPRARSYGLPLQARAFLHDYDASADVDGLLLEQILTAPVIVAHWINMQYHASTVDPLHYGSGNKLLHNVVGGHIGVFEGNAGDLRIGLPLQSVHDGGHWRHTPLRLSVFVEAPAARIDAILSRHPTLQQLVGNHWLHLFRLDGRMVEVYRSGGWQHWYGG